MATLPSLSKAYSTIRNMPFPDTSSNRNTIRSMNWLLKEAMLGNLNGGTQGGTRDANSLWVVEKSCGWNGSAYVTSASDNWTDYTTITMENEHGSGHAWTLLKNVALGYYCAISFGHTDETQQRVAYWPIAQSYSGGTSQTDQPHNDSYEFDLCMQSVNSYTNIAAQVSYQAGGTLYAHYTTSTDGQFHFEVSRAGQGFFMFATALIKTVSAQAGDTVNLLGVCQQYGSYRGAFHNMNDSYMVSARTPGGALWNNGYGLGPLMSYGAGNVENWGADGLSGQYWASQVDAITTSSGGSFYRGTLPDWFYISGGGVGDCIPSAAACERVIVGSLILPFIGGAPIL